MIKHSLTFIIALCTMRCNITDIKSIIYIALNNNISNNNINNNIELIKSVLYFNLEIFAFGPLFLIIIQ